MWLYLINHNITIFTLFFKFFNTPYINIHTNDISISAFNIVMNNVPGNKAEGYKMDGDNLILYWHCDSGDKDILKFFKEKPCILQGFS